jgi:hypothetical protein
MPESSNDSLWDPRPRLEREAEHLGAAEDVPPDSGAVLVELAATPGMSPVAALDLGRQLERPGFTLDEEFGAVPLGDVPQQTFVVRGYVSGDTIVSELERDTRVVKVWRDTPVAPF